MSIANIKKKMKRLSFFIFALALAWNAGAAEEQYPVGHPDQGLPRPEFVPAPYHEDPNHTLNRVFRASYLASITPAEVGLALPREHGDPAEFFRKPWYFAVRPGTPADRKLFGGDARLLSREGFSPAEATAFARALAEVDGEGARSLKQGPELAVLFQHDLLRMAQRLVETGRNPELLKPIGEAIKRVSLTSAQLLQLPSTYELGLRHGNLDSALPPDLLTVNTPVHGPYVELLRNSTRVFEASRTLAWSRVFISWPSSREGLMGFLSAQCTLCHRLHGVSDAYLGGFITLGPSARPRPAATGSERLRLAERETSQFLANLRKATKD